jgi:hypothetical protein
MLGKGGVDPEEVRAENRWHPLRFSRGLPDQAKRFKTVTLIPLIVLTFAALTCLEGCQ